MFMNQLEQTLALYFGQKAPTLPENVKQFITKIAPWANLVFVILAIPGLLALLGISFIALPVTVMTGLRGGVFTTILALVSVVLIALAIPGLFKYSRQGWLFIFYSNLVTLVQYLIQGDLFNLIVVGLISFYLLFQVRSYYK